MFATLGMALMMTNVCQAGAAELAEARKLFQCGEFSQVVRMAKKELEEEIFLREHWYVLMGDSQMATGEYGAALESARSGLEKQPNSIRLRWLGIHACRFQSDTKTAELAKAWRGEISERLRRSSWQYRDVPNQLVIARIRLEEGVDAKTVLDDVYGRTKDRYPADARTYVAIGELALGKHEYNLAATNFNKALQLDANCIAAHYGLARAYAPNLAEQSQQSLERALEIDKLHVPSLLLVAENQIAAEAYGEAAKSLGRVLKVNRKQPEAWAFRAVLAHLKNDRGLESQCRAEALKHFATNPMVDWLIGRELSKKYRFLEASQYQRRALKLDGSYLPAKMQLAHDLLRLGQELEGWTLAEQVFDADQYNVVASNLVTLRDHLSQFATLERDGLIVRMERGEADAYGHLVLDLLEEASQQLSEKYQVELQKPIFIEIFPQQQDFAIRTFGVPGGAGFLGVCFGRVVTMNSPVAQGASQTNWRSVLWHEFCHVVTLQKTKNRMPRWLSEGISVHEEMLANPAWGNPLNAGNRVMILSGELTPVSELSSAFLRPKSGEHLQFAYFESAMVVKFLVERFGEPAMNQLLDSLAGGLAINDALARHMAPLKLLDREFEKYAMEQARSLGGEVDWEIPESSPRDLDGWKRWLNEHPKSYHGLLKVAQVLQSAGEHELALKMLDRFHKACSEIPGSEVAYRIAARAHRGLSQGDEERIALESVVKLDANDLDASLRLSEIYRSESRWDDLARMALRSQAINPMLKSPHASMAVAAEELEDDDLLVQELNALLSLGPFDRADVHYRLGSAELRRGKLEPSRRHALLALEAAPRYRDAHRLLLKIHERLGKSKEEAKDAPDGSANKIDAMPLASDAESERDDRSVTDGEK